jgi:hypothetical protein
MPQNELLEDPAYIKSLSTRQIRIKSKKSIFFFVDDYEKNQPPKQQNENSQNLIENPRPHLRRRARL